MNINTMGEIFKGNKDNIVRWINIILIILIYYFGVIRENEKVKTEVEILTKKIDNVEVKIDNNYNKLSESKADKEMLNILMLSINRIENKLDKIILKE